MIEKVNSSTQGTGNGLNRKLLYAAYIVLCKCLPQRPTSLYAHFMHAQTKEYEILEE